MMKPNRQHEQILAIHRDMEWHCSTSYEFMRDHRKRISELNLGYLAEKGYVLAAKRCDGRCGKKHNSMVAMRRAEKLPEHVIRNLAQQNPPEVAPILSYKD